MAEASKEATPSKKKKPTMLLIIAGAVLLLGAGGAGAWFFMQNHQADPAAMAEAQRKKDMKTRVFVPLDTFTVNLADEAEARLAQVGVVLQVRDSATADEIKALMPMVRSRVLMILSSKLARDLLSAEGKQQLALQIGDATAILLGRPAEPVRQLGAADGVDAASVPVAAAEPLVRVNFSQFLVQ
ncbi:MAG: flagellar basal body-associated FliL family protein [Burkholderiaceae bacterium]